MAIITKIEMQKNKQDRVNIYLDGEFFCAMQHFVCVKRGLKENLEMEPDVLRSYSKESDTEQAMNKVAKLLERSLKTQKQLETYLKGKGYDDQIVNHVVGKLMEYGIIDDEKYAKQYVATYSKKAGKRKMEYELKQKGIPERIVKKVLQETQTSQEVLVAIAKKFLKSKPITLENLQKLSNHLAYKGFQWDEISPVLKLFKKELEE